MVPGARVQGWYLSPPACWQWGRSRARPIPRWAPAAHVSSMWTVLGQSWLSSSPEFIPCSGPTLGEVRSWNCEWSSECSKHEGHLAMVPRRAESTCWIKPLSFRDWQEKEYRRGKRNERDGPGPSGLFRGV